jgi:hypothetical protein
MHKWKISFDGKGDGEVIAFIKDVENMASSQGTTVEELRQGISTLLKDKAHDWYRVYGSQCGPWTDFVDRIKEEYLPADFDFQVHNEIRRTLQTEKETFQEFCVRIELVFMKLSYVIMESQKLDHIKHNMHRNYKSPEIAKIRNINELRDACRYVDSFDERLKTPEVLVQPQRPANVRQNQRVYEVETGVTVREESVEEEPPSSAESMCQQENNLQREIQELQAQSREFRRNLQSQERRPNMSERICYNCQQPGHFANNCTRPQQARVITCHGCGARGILRRNCRNCQQHQVSGGNVQSAGNEQRTQ